MKTNYGYTGNQNRTDNFLNFYGENGKSGFNNNQTEGSYNNSITSVIDYQCPMKCEGEKTYDKPGKCPLCNMQMMPAGCGYIFY